MDLGHLKPYSVMKGCGLTRGKVMHVQIILSNAVTKHILQLNGLIYLVGIRPENEMVAWKLINPSWGGRTCAFTCSACLRVSFSLSSSSLGGGNAVGVRSARAT